MALATSIASFFRNAGTGTWIDIVCLVLMVILVIADARRGLSDTIGALIGLFAGFNAGLWARPVIRSALGNSAFFGSHSTLLAVAALVLAVLVAAAVFVIFRVVLSRFFRLVVDSPLDNILGAVAGLAKALLIILALFTFARFVPGDPAGAALSSSRVGRQVVPAAMRAIGGAAQTAGAVPEKSRK